MRPHTWITIGMCMVILCVSVFPRRIEQFDSDEIDFYTTFNDSIEIVTYRDIPLYLKKDIQHNLHTQWSNYPYDESHISTVWSKPNVFLVLVEKNRLVGTMGVIISSKTPYISNLFITKPYRKQGLASKLLTHVESKLQQKGFHNVMLSCYEELLPYYMQKKYTIHEKQNINKKINYVMMKQL